MTKRLAQAWHLLGCSFRVLLYGPLSPFEIDPRFAEAIKAVMDTAESEDEAAPELMNTSTLRTKLTRDIQSRVARKLGLSRSHVCMVANDHRQSRSVETALAEEYARVERDIQWFEHKHAGLTA